MFQDLEGKAIVDNNWGSSVYKRYSLCIEAVIDFCNKKQREQAMSQELKPRIELTFGSFMIEELFPQLINDYSEQVDLWIGTVLTAKEAEILLQMKIPEGKQIYALSPVFDPEVAGMLAGTNFIYVPGCFDLEDYQAIVSFYQEQNLKLDFLKIFPFGVEGSEEIFRALQGPFLELREGNSQGRISLKVENIKDQESLQVTKPQDYFGIREQAMSKSGINVFFRDLELDSSQIKRGLELAKHIKEINPELRLLASGIAEAISLEALESCSIDFWAANIIKGRFNNARFWCQDSKSIKKDLLQDLSNFEGICS